VLFEETQKAPVCGLAARTHTGSFSAVMARLAGGVSQRMCVCCFFKDHRFFCSLSQRVYVGKQTKLLRQTKHFFF
jgi:hypothetical protein